MEYFLGRYDYAMDERGRVPLPPRYRDAFLKGAVLNQGPDPCLRLFTPESFEQQAELYTRELATERKGREMRQSFFANCFSVELDRQGRILIPQPLRTYASLDASVLVSGAGEWLEIWHPDRFQQRMAAVAAADEDGS